MNSGGFQLALILIAVLSDLRSDKVVIGKNLFDNDGATKAVIVTPAIYTGCTYIYPLALVHLFGILTYCRPIDKSNDCICCFLKEFNRIVFA